MSLCMAWNKQSRKFERPAPILAVQLAVFLSLFAIQASQVFPWYLHLGSLFALELPATGSFSFGALRHTLRPRCLDMIISLVVT